MDENNGRFFLKHQLGKIKIIESAIGRD